MNISVQRMYSQSELPIVVGGQQDHMDGLAMTDNPYPAVCQVSLRHHWLWDQGWLMKDMEKAMNKETA
jgi:hypothetical protein